MVSLLPLYLKPLIIDNEYFIFIAGDDIILAGQWV
jgi:hypothetical protein